MFSFFYFVCVCVSTPAYVHVRAVSRLRVAAAFYLSALTGLQLNENAGKPRIDQEQRCEPASRHMACRFGETVPKSKPKTPNKHAMNEQVQLCVALFEPQSLVV